MKRVKEITILIEFSIVLLFSCKCQNLLDELNNINNTNNKLSNNIMVLENNRIDLENENMSLLSVNELLNKTNTEIISSQIEYEKTLIEPLKNFDKIEYLKKYNSLSEKYDNIIETKELYNSYSNLEILYMQKCIETETYQTNFSAKCNIASVILNRLDNNTFPNNPISVITEKNQFEYFRDEISEDTKFALEYVFKLGDTTSGATYFYSNESEWHENNLEYIFTDSVGHKFYK
ncbi:MAG: cell wall hydrolase [Bacilli bacterium]